jgi:chaperone LolA
MFEVGFLNQENRKAGNRGMNLKTKKTERLFLLSCVPDSSVKSVHFPGFLASKLILLFCFICFSAQAEPLSPNDLKALVGRIREKRAAAPQVQADFQEEKTIRMMNKPVVSSGKVWFQAPNKFRREVKGNTPSVTVSDGQTLWIYYPKFQSAERYSLGKHSPLDAGIAAITASLNLENVEQTYHITGSSEASGSVLNLAPRTPSMKRMLQTFAIHIDGELQVRRTEMLQPNGDRIVTTYSNETRAPIDAAMFQFTPPAGTNITTPLGH